MFTIPHSGRINSAENWLHTWPALAAMIAGSSSPLKNTRITEYLLLIDIGTRDDVY